MPSGNYAWESVERLIQRHELSPQVSQVVDQQDRMRYFSIHLSGKHLEELPLSFRKGLTDITGSPSFLKNFAYSLTHHEGGMLLEVARLGSPEADSFPARLRGERRQK